MTKTLNDKNKILQDNDAVKYTIGKIHGIALENNKIIESNIENLFPKSKGNDKIFLDDNLKIIIKKHIKIIQESYFV